MCDEYGISLHSTYYQQFSLWSFYRFFLLYMMIWDSFDKPVAEGICGLARFAKANNFHSFPYFSSVENISEGFNKPSSPQMLSATGLSKLTRLQSKSKFIREGISTLAAHVIYFTLLLDAFPNKKNTPNKL